MTQTAAGGRPGRSGRRAGDSGTRAAILAAARQRFAEHGYDGATIRGIAADAAVDPALVHHYYGTKEHLFAAAMALPAVPSEVIAAAAGQAGPGGGERLVAAILAIWENTEVHTVMAGLLRSAMTSEAAARLLREFLADAILRPVGALARGADPADARFRAGMVASQMLGVALTRYVLRLPPVADADLRDLAAALGPTVDRYLTGDLSPAAT